MKRLIEAEEQLKAELAAAQQREQRFLEYVISCDKEPLQERIEAAIKETKELRE